MSCYVYILESERNGTLYIGMTDVIGIGLKLTVAGRWQP
jgi:hypothetical protein